MSDDDYQYQDVKPHLKGSQMPLMNQEKMDKIGEAVHHLSTMLPPGSKQDLLDYAVKSKSSEVTRMVMAYLSLCEALDLDTEVYHGYDGSKDAAFRDPIVASERDGAYEASTIMALRVIELMRSCDCDANIIQNEFIGEIGDYEREIAAREGIEIKE